MKNKQILRAGFFLSVAGILLTGVGIVLGGEPGFYVDRNGIHMSSGFHKEAHEKKKEKIEDIQEVWIDVDYADIHLIPSDDFYLEYYLTGSENKPKLEIRDGSLSLEEAPSSGMKISFLNFDLSGLDDELHNRYCVNLYYPEKTEFSSVTLTAEEGDIETGNLSAKNLSIEDHYGTVKTGMLNADKADFSIEEGNLEAEGLEAEKLTVEEDYGNVKLQSLYCEEGRLILQEGNLEVNKADYGELRVENEYGDVKLEIPQWEAGSMDLKTEYGKISIPEKVKINYDEDGEEASYKQEGRSDQLLKVVCEDGDIEIVE